MASPDYSDPTLSSRELLALFDDEDASEDDLVEAAANPNLPFAAITEQVTSGATADMHVRNATVSDAMLTNPGLTLFLLEDMETGQELLVKLLVSEIAGRIPRHLRLPGKSARRSVFQAFHGRLLPTVTARGPSQAWLDSVVRMAFGVWDDYAERGDFDLGHYHFLATFERELGNHRFTPQERGRLLLETAAILAMSSQDAREALRGLKAEALLFPP